MGLELREIVADVVDHTDTEVGRRTLERLLEDVADPVGDDLPVRPGEVGGRAHRGEIFLRLGGRQRGARQLGVGQVDREALARARIT